MAKNMSRLLTNALEFIRTDGRYSAAEWELLLWQAKAAGLLPRLAFYRSRFGFFDAPDYVLPHLNSAEKFWLSQKRIVDWELYNLQLAFEQLQLPLILLKGTAYAAAHLNASLGRVFNDIDILVPKSRLHEVKDVLKWSGWIPEQMDSYDQNYYERWMHELPPMRHIQRGTSLDIHHNILPETCALCPDAELLLKEAISITGSPFWQLAPTDMILHSASHLFWNGEFENGLRDLSDLDLLCREFSDKDNAFWQKLLSRADELGMGKPLFYALRYLVKILRTPIPETIIRKSALYASGMAVNRVMDFLFLRALMPIHPSCNDGWSGIARWVLFVRSHYLRMPLNLLIPHLSRKTWLRLAGKN